LTRRGLDVTVLEALPQLMSTVDPELAGEVADTLEGNGVRVHTGTGGHRRRAGLARPARAREDR
jgi:NADPH-dependent 2,4-dienoyl-CoA reductase/sulfur reductase-like enzyme